LQSRDLHSHIQSIHGLHKLTHSHTRFCSHWSFIHICSHCLFYAHTGEHHTVPLPHLRARLVVQLPCWPWKTCGHLPGEWTWQGPGLKWGRAWTKDAGIPPLFRCTCVCVCVYVYGRACCVCMCVRVCVCVHLYMCVYACVHACSHPKKKFKDR